MKSQVYACNLVEERNNKINVPVPRKVSDEEYLELVRESFIKGAKAFAPEAIFWTWGYDGTQGEYGACHRRGV